MRDTPPTQDEPTSLRSVNRALTALELVADAGELGVTELGRRLGVHKATASRLAATLADRGLLERDLQTDRYRLGFGLVRLAGGPEGRARLLRSGPANPPHPPPRPQQTRANRGPFPPAPLAGRPGT